MRAVTMFFSLVFLVVFVGCATEGPSGKTIVINTNPGGSADASVSPPDKASAEVYFCSVRMTFFMENGQGKSITFVNENDATVIVDIVNTTTGGVVAKHCLWGHDQASQEVAFAKGDTLSVSVRIGEGQIWHWTCAEFIDDILHNFPPCDSYLVAIQ